MAIRYIPILKFKRGELTAISDLLEPTKDSVCPLLVATPPAIDADSGDIIDTVDTVLNRYKELIIKCWKDRSFLLDFWYYPDASEFFESNRDKVKAFFIEHPQAIPCFPVYDEGTAGRPLIDARGFGAKIGYRILTNLIEDEELVSSTADSIHKDPGATVCSVILDLGFIGGAVADKRRTAKLFLSEIEEITGVDDFSVKALTGTSFPAGIPPGRYAIHRFPREEKEIWDSLKSKDGLVFSDYATVNPEHKDFDPRTMSLGGKIRYTLDKEFVIVKGESIKNGGSDQFRELAEMLTKMTGFRGEGFSWGDDQIISCAEGGPKGNQETWVRVAVNQHIEFMVEIALGMPGAA